MGGRGEAGETIIAAAVGLWFAQGWYLNTRLERVHKKLDLIFEQFDGCADTGTKLTRSLMMSGNCSLNYIMPSRQRPLAFLG